MPQIAIRGVFQDGKIIPLEDVPFKEPCGVIIVFNDNSSDESRYYTPGWKLAEQQASEDYKAGHVKSAKNIDAMFHKIENDKFVGTKYFHKSKHV